MKKIAKVLPRCCDESHLISISLKRRLTDKSAYNQQHIRPSVVNAALKKLIEINPFYCDVTISNNWEKLNESSDPELWKILTEDTNDLENNYDSPTDSDESDNDEHEQIHKSGIPNPTCMHDTDGISSEQAIDIAPGEGQIPVSIYNEPDCEALAFPNLFATGHFHHNEPNREKYITPSKYVHARLKCCDSRFASDPRYIFFALDWLEKEAITNAINFTERKYKQSVFTVGQLQNSDNVKKFISDDEMFAVFKTIRGTPQYFHNMQLDMLAKTRHFGVHTWFLTWSANLFQWTNIIKNIAREYGEELSDEVIENMDWSTKVKYLKRNPVSVARQIDHVFKTLWGEVVMSGMHPIGQILNFDERGEFQNGTGNKHIHSGIHVKDAPKVDEDSDETVIEYVDTFVTAALPDEKKCKEFHDLVKRVQTHHHTQTCRKKKGVTCRFHAPWPIASKTTISRANVVKSDLKQAQYIINSVINIINNTEDLSKVTERELIDMAGYSVQEYYDALEAFKSKTSIVYKRKPTETLISPYNTVILDMLKANMNIQFVVGIYGVLAYLTSYLCKPEHAMSELMKKACKEAVGSGMKEKLHDIGHVFRTKREISTTEAIVRSLSMPLRRSNIDVIYVPTGLKKNRTRVLKPKQVLERMHEVNPDDEDVFALSIFDKYANRPDTLENVCLAYFVSNYKHKAAENAGIDDDETPNGFFNAVAGYVDVPNNSSTIKLKNDCGDMRKRSRPCVIRWHSVSKEKSPEEYFLRLLQLYMPWRNEDELLHVPSGTYVANFEEFREVIEDNMKDYEKYKEYTAEDLENPYSMENDDDTDDSDDDHEDAYSVLDPDILECNELSNENSPNSSTVRDSVKKDYSMANTQFYEMCYKLNAGQRYLFNYISTFVQKLLHNESNGIDLPDPFYIFLSGGGGVGKSHLVISISEYLKRMLKFACQRFDQPSVVLTASTGVAACRISGTTLHSAFKLPLTNSGNGFPKISDQQLHILRLKYAHLKVVVIDEISMVGINTFEDFNKMLQRIMGNNHIFGGVSILAVGDFMQLPPVKQRSVYSDSEANSYTCLSGSLWKDNFGLHELREIVRQVDDPEWAALISRIRTGDQTEDDINVLKSLDKTDTSVWPNQYTTLYLTNLLSQRENEKELDKLSAEKFVIVAKDNTKDVATRRYPVSVPEDKPLHETANLPGKLRLCVGARCMLTKNIDLEDHLPNGLTGTIVHLNFSRANPLNGKIYVKFDEPKAGNLRKKKYVLKALTDCVPISAEVFQ